MVKRLILFYYVHQVKVIFTESWDVAQRLLNAELKVLYALSKHSLPNYIDNSPSSAKYQKSPSHSVDVKLGARETMMKTLETETANHQSSYIVKFYAAFFDANQEGCMAKYTIISALLVQWCFF